VLRTVDYSNRFEVYFSNPKSWVLWAILDLHDYISYFLINVLVVVLVFAAYCLLLQQSDSNFLFKNYENSKIFNKFSESKKFIKSYHKFKLEDFCHAPRVEFFWTVVPLIMLAFMGWPSFKTLYAVEQLVDPLHSVVVVGNQWYWSYGYSDFDIISNLILELDTKKNMDMLKEHAIKKFAGDNLVLCIELSRAFKNKDLFQLISKYFRDYEESKIMYDCVIISDEDLPKGYPRLLSTDQVLVLPSHTIVRLMITSNDVIHSWALPSHGIKMDAVPGRINQVNFITSFWGTYWGQCSELCGINHGFMPIEVRVLPMNDYFDFIRLNSSYRVDKFIPLLELLTELYLKYLSYKLKEDDYCFWFDVFVDDEDFIEGLTQVDIEIDKSEIKKLFLTGIYRDFDDCWFYHRLAEICKGITKGYAYRNRKN